MYLTDILSVNQRFDTVGLTMPLVCALCQLVKELMLHMSLWWRNMKRLVLHVPSENNHHASFQQIAVTTL